MMSRFVWAVEAGTKFSCKVEYTYIERASSSLLLASCAILVELSWRMLGLESVLPLNVTLVHIVVGGGLESCLIFETSWENALVQ